ncbi:MAG: DedA family protein [Candidatus Woesearchaeota archaeon]
MLDIIVFSYLVKLAYIALFLIPVLSSIGLPFSEELLLMATGYLMYTGFFRIDLGFVLCFLGIIAGDNLGYYVGKKGGFFLDWLLTPRRRRKAQRFFDRHGAKAVFFGRFLVGPRFWMPLIAGASGMRWKTFFAYTSLGAMIVTPFYLVIGYFVGKNLKHIIAISHELSDFVMLSLMIIVVLVCLYICIFRKHFRRKIREDTLLDDWLEKDEPYQIATFGNPETGNAERFIAKIRKKDRMVKIIVSQMHDGVAQKFIKFKKWISLKKYQAMIKWRARFSKPKIEKWE